MTGKAREMKHNQNNTNIDEILIKFVSKSHIEADEGKVLQTAEKCKAALWESFGQNSASYFEFLYQQCRYIKKRWWALQLGILAAMGLLLRESGGYAAQRIMGVAASLFVAAVMPELWKNRACGGMEVEGAAYYPLRLIYSARMLLFAAADGLLLCFFAGFAVRGAGVGPEELAKQFFLPMMVACAICFRMLSSRFAASEYLSVFFMLLWNGVWTFLILRDEIYAAISAPVWAAAFACAALYLAYAVRRSLRECGNFWEVNSQWS